jgi:hypothetical protein
VRPMSSKDTVTSIGCLTVMVSIEDKAKSVELASYILDVMSVNDAYQIKGDIVSAMIDMGLDSKFLEMLKKSGFLFGVAGSTHLNAEQVRYISLNIREVNSHSAGHSAQRLTLTI